MYELFPLYNIHYTLKIYVKITFNGFIFYFKSLYSKPSMKYEYFYFAIILFSIFLYIHNSFVLKIKIVQHLFS